MVEKIINRQIMVTIGWVIGNGVKQGEWVVFGEHEQN